jgi:hypothetical protein
MKTERIDFHMLSDGRCVVVKMHRDDDELRDIPHSHEIKAANDGFDLDTALEWCEEHGFTVLWWWNEDGHKCARAFLGEPWPIRRNFEIKRLRERLEGSWTQGFHKNPGKWQRIERLIGMDLAFAG